MALRVFDHRHEPAPVCELVRQYWVMVGASNRPFVCALYRTTAGLELRAGHGEQDALLYQPVVTAFAAETFAAAWRVAAEAKGFVDVGV